jgi:hypothetical protein
MSDRWKYMLKIALFWAGFMTAFMLVFDYFDKESAAQFVPWKIILRFAVYFVFGLGLGYFNWRSRTKESKK